MIWNIITVAAILAIAGAVVLRVRSGNAHPVALGAMILPPTVFATHPPGGRALVAAMLGAVVLILLYTSTPKTR